MVKFCCLIATLFFFSCKSATYYIVRHAEKETATMSQDVGLSPAGQERAISLEAELRNKHIKSIYSTNYARTKATAEPLARALGRTIEIYSVNDTAFIDALRTKAKGPVLIVGHSNTVDDIVNRLMGSKTIAEDLPDHQYGDIFIVKRRGNSYTFDKGHFGK